MSHKPKRSTHMVRPFGHRVTLTAAPLLERDETANVQLAFRGETPEGWGPLGGFGLGVKMDSLMRYHQSHS